VSSLKAALSSDRRTISAMIGGINAEEVRWATVLIAGTG
jgi:hypothetical protein